MSKSSRASQQSSRRARVEELRREQRAKERRRTLIAVGSVAVAVVVIIVVVAFALNKGSGGSTPTSSPGLNTADQIIPSSPTGTETTEKPPKQITNPTSIKGVLAWDTSGYPASGTPNAGTVEHDHVTGPVKYAVIPPVGGPHNANWMNAGVYTKPIPPERAVHNLEHGAVWITYNPDIPASQIKLLVSFVARQTMIPETEQTSPGQENRYVDLSPWTSSSLPAPIVISSWGYQLRVNNPSDPRLQQFVDTFRNSSTYSPEFGSPVDGIPIETGGRPAGYGSKNANPPGAA